MLPEFSFSTVTYGIAFLLRTRGCTAQRECAIARWYWFAENNTRVSHVTTYLSSEEALVAPIRTKVSIDTIVQSICLLASGLIATVPRLRLNRERATHNLPKENSLWPLKKRCTPPTYIPRVART